MTQSQKSLETITKDEAERLVDAKVFSDKIAAICVGSAAASAGTFAYLRDKYESGHKIFTETVLNFTPQLPDWDYDKVLVGFMTLLAIGTAVGAADAIYSAVTARKKYNLNPSDFIRKNYNKKLI